MKKQNSKAFTLVELLTVVAIIALLISILVPTVQRAQRQAKEVAIKAQHHGITQGLEMFKSDFGYYPTSLPQTSDGVNINDNRDNYTSVDPEITGSHRLAFALMGRDKLGCPAKTGATWQVGGHDVDTDPDSVTGWYYSTSPDGSFEGTWEGPDDADWGSPGHKTARKGPYINPEGFSVVADETMNLGTSSTNPPDDYVWLLCDKYNKKTDPITATSQYQNYSMILYYKANDRGKYLRNNGSGGTNDNDQIYYFEDNRVLTPDSRFKDVNGDGHINEEDFFDFIQDKNASIGNFDMPHNRESFLLISPGWDNTYGTDDDIVNWAR